MWRGTCVGTQGEKAVAARVGGDCVSGSRVWALPGWPRGPTSARQYNSGDPGAFIARLCLTPQPQATVTGSPVRKVAGRVSSGQGDTETCDRPRLPAG